MILYSLRYNDEFGFSNRKKLKNRTSFTRIDFTNTVSSEINRLRLY